MTPRLILALLLAPALARAAGATTFTVVVAPSGDMTYEPAALVVQVGDTVQWQWDGNGHSVTAGTGCVPDPDPPFPSHFSDFSFTFTAPGRYPYFCAVENHCLLGMTGLVTVQQLIFADGFETGDLSAWSSAVP